MTDDSKRIILNWALRLAAPAAPARIMHYTVIVQECWPSSTPWVDPVQYSRAGAWKRIQALAAQIVPDWPHPLLVRVWAHHTQRTADARHESRVLVYTGDLRAIRAQNV